MIRAHLRNKSMHIETDADKIAYSKQLSYCIRLI